MRIKFVDLERQIKLHKLEFEEALKLVLEKTDFILGEELKEFENNFANYVNAKYAIGVGSGLDALRLALIVAGIKNGDEVILPVNTFIATALAISSIGAKPVFADIDEEIYNIDTSRIENAITSKTKAIIPVHLYGHSADMDPILNIAKKYNLVVIEDACQAHGALYKNKKVGSIGDLGCFSFYPGKNLGAFGDGGMIVTNNDFYAEQLYMLRNYGQEKKYYHKIRGFNTRLDTIQSATLNVKLKYLDIWNDMRIKNAELYSKLLKDNKNIILPKVKSDCKHVFHLYVIRVKCRDELMEYLKSQGIDVLIHYPIPIHLQEAYRDLGYKEGDFPIAEKVAKEIISLPMFPELTSVEIEYIVEKINEFYSGSK